MKNMNKKNIIGFLVILIFVLGGFFLMRGAKEIVVEEKTFNLEESRKIAEDWIIHNSPTYVYDGFDLDLVFEEELIEGVFLFSFSFQSRAAGYGDRQDEMVAQVITLHEIEVVVEQGEVVSAITDGVYDEISGQMLVETRQINLYFVKVVEGQEEIVAVERSIPYSDSPEEMTIEELLNGPLPHEKTEGLSTSINEGTRLQSISIQDGVALVDFNDKLGEGVAGSAWVMAIRGQIEKTLLQFSSVDEVIISIDGRAEDILQP